MSSIAAPQLRRTLQRRTYAVLHLRALASGPAHEEPLPEPVSKARQLGRRFEQALG